MTIAVHFVGSIVEHSYPEIGKEKPFATATLRRLIDEGHKLILWTVREGELLDQAVEWCRRRGVVFYEVNRDFDEDLPEVNKNYTRKLKVQLFIDDRNVGGLPDWGTIYQLIKEKTTYRDYLLRRSEQPRKKKRWLW